MVFSANAIESGPNNFAAFQALAEQLNGTSTSTSSATSSSSSTTSSQHSSGTQLNRGAGVALSFAALLLGVLL